MITNALTEATSKVAIRCNSINVVSDGLMRSKCLVEVSFDLCKKKLRCQAQTRIQTRKRGSKLFGKLVDSPYLHYLISSRIDYPVQDVSSDFHGYESITVRNHMDFKIFYGQEQRIFVNTVKESILFCGCHLWPQIDSTIQSDCFYDDDEDAHEELDYEIPNKPFKYLFKFMGMRVNNFMMFIKEAPLKEEYGQANEPETFKVGNITFKKLIPSCVKERIRKEEECIRHQLLKSNFYEGDNWNNINEISHVISRNSMVLPEFVINHMYYSTHVIFKDIELVGRSEFLP